MDERIAGQLTLLSFYRRYVIAETLTKKAQKWSFCAREEGDWNREVQPLPSSKSPRIAMKVNCLVMRYLHFGSVRGDLLERRTGQVAGISSIQHLRPDQAAALFATQHLRPGQAAASFGGDTEVA